MILSGDFFVSSNFTSPETGIDGLMVKTNDFWKSIGKVFSLCNYKKKKNITAG